MLYFRAMLYNEQDYPDPHEFRPEHFLWNRQLNSSVRDLMDIAFGFSRRWAFITSLYLNIYHHHLVESVSANTLLT
jgi:hypothetical protein